MHIVYICAFYGSPWFLGMQWSDFLHEFISNLTKLVANNFNREIFMEVVHFLNELIWLDVLNNIKLIYTFLNVGDIRFSKHY